MIDEPKFRVCLERCSRRNTVNSGMTASDAVQLMNELSDQVEDTTVIVAEDGKRGWLCYVDERGVLRVPKAMLGDTPAVVAESIEPPATMTDARFLAELPEWFRELLADVLAEDGDARENMMCCRVADLDLTVGDWVRVVAEADGRWGY